MRTRLLAVTLLAAACTAPHSDVAETQHPPIACTLAPGELNARRTGPVTFEVTGPPGTREMLRSL